MEVNGWIGPSCTGHPRTEMDMVTGVEEVGLLDTVNSMVLLIVVVRYTNISHDPDTGPFSIPVILADRYQ
jgi:hypothetical protein